ncbi:MAG: aminodeoxychorismate/anthranilate synthase component II [Candidatus Dormibacteraeota bacterium]|uniref:Aminodeoxychorismate/anthranilate synthase component II n=1 Tax=Candidatus Amunia macphersoniae TaxID=3127014 RepID=A0A934KNX9_9BACT|nr:aminodeoxychorismate/anthranilate synthase component II [Candidatus Dormibacteraeota bacterium]
MDGRVLVVDNYDSFTYNLVQYLGELGATTVVVRNDAVDVGDVIASRPAAVVLSPGPGRPEDAGICVDVVLAAAQAAIPLLGVCLGHQAIAVAFGGRVVPAAVLMHGKCSDIEHRGSGVFSGLPSPIRATRYHSLVAARTSLPASLEVTAWTADGTVMGMRHREHPIEGVQFHPESIGTHHGRAMLATMLTAAEVLQPAPVPVPS